MSKIRVTEENLEIMAMSAGISEGLIRTSPSQIGTEE